MGKAASRGSVSEPRALRPRAASMRQSNVRIGSGHDDAYAPQNVRGKLPYPLFGRNSGRKAVSHFSWNCSGNLEQAAAAFDPTFSVSASLASAVARLQDSANLDQVQQHKEDIPADDVHERRRLAVEIHGEADCGRCGEDSQPQNIQGEVGDHIHDIRHVYENFHVFGSI